MKNEQLEDLMYRAGLTAQGCWDSMDQYDREAIMDFAKLVAAAEREACAKIADKCIEDSEKVTTESEQEENYMVAMRILSEEFAIAIRARGET